MTADTHSNVVIIYTIITGLGLGTTMPVFTIAVQNAVPFNQLGVATSSTAFFRSIGGSVGLAVLGSIMSNRFSNELISRIPDTVKNAIPADKLSSMVHNPQALVNPAAQSQLQSTLGPLYAQVIHGLREALSLALSDTFLIGMFIIIAGFTASFFLKEIPLRKHRGPVPQPAAANIENKPVALSSEKP